MLIKLEEFPIPEGKISYMEGKIDTFAAALLRKVWFKGLKLIMNHAFGNSEELKGS